MGGQIQAAYNIFPGWRFGPLVVRRLAFPSLVGGFALTLSNGRQVFIKEQP